MAIELTYINGTDSIASMRITLNDNFQTLTETINNVLSIINLGTGEIDNTDGNVSRIKTNELQVKSLIKLLDVNATLDMSNSGVISLGKKGSIFFGSNNEIKLIESVDSQNASYLGLDLSADENLSYVILPNMISTDITDIDAPVKGMSVLGDDDKLYIYNGTSWKTITL